MHVAFEEIWSFLDELKEQSAEWHFQLIAGSCEWEQASIELLRGLENDSTYDVELLPNLFTFREIYWQPNVYPTLSACLTGLNLLANFCDEFCEIAQTVDVPTASFYQKLVLHAGQLARKAHEQLTTLEDANERIPSVLGEFRKQSFPVIMLFVLHPMNRRDYRQDALRRVNFMVKTLINQYQLQYNDLLFPYWEASRKVATAEKLPAQGGDTLQEQMEDNEPGTEN